MVTHTHPSQVIGGQAGVFVLAQQLPAMGASGMEAFSIPGYGKFLAVAARQSDAPYIDNGVYDQPSALYQWGGATGRFVLHQELGSTFRSAMAPFDIRHKNFSTTNRTLLAPLEAAYSAAATQRFCGAGGCDAAQDGTLTVPGLRGATGMRFFAHRGEYYLAVAQSVCEQGWGREKCVEHAQPKSAVLQWNRAAKAFGELLAMDNVDSVALRGVGVPEEEIMVHSFAMRIEAGRASDWEYVSIGGVPYLLVSSGTKGVLMYTWEFAQVTGLNGAISVASDLADTAVFVASSIDRALVILDRGALLDGLGRSLCGRETDAPVACLNFRAALVDARAPSGLPPPAAPVVEGLAGARKLTVRCPIAPQAYVNDSLCGEGNVTDYYNPDTGFRNYTLGEVCVLVPRALEPPVREARDLFWLEGASSGNCDVVVFGGPLRDETLCHAGAAPPRHDPRGPPVCQAVSFSVSVLSSTNAALFSEPPEVSWDGTLTFAAAPLQIGEARLRVDMSDSGGVLSNDGRTWGHDTAPPRFVTLRVLAVNRKPVFQAHDIMVNQNNGWERVVFAADVTPGAAHEAAQNLVWEVQDNAPDGFFVDAPRLAVAIIDGQMFGIARFRLAAGSVGEVRFNVTLVDDGPVDAAVGHAGRSEAQAFALTVRGMNQPPSFVVLQPVVRITEGEASYTIANFAANITAGSPLEDRTQDATFAVFSVEALDSSWDPRGLVTRFALAWRAPGTRAPLPHAGTLLLSLAPFRDGLFRIVVVGVDDGPAGGAQQRNASYIPFLLDVRGVFQDPALTGPSALDVPEAKS
ncbi:hypothetical protein T484DRAFT_1802530, partial [Baffinella frigidus]